jgi:hypothetical protein
MPCFPCNGDNGSTTPVGPDATTTTQTTTQTTTTTTTTTTSNYKITQPNTFFSAHDCVLGFFPTRQDFEIIGLLSVKYGLLSNI